MYDLPEVASQTDALWRAISTRLRSAGVDAPEQLHRSSAPLVTLWKRPQLLLSHTCGYPLVSTLADQVNVLGSWATATDLVGRPGWYRSIVVARQDDKQAEDLGAYVRSGLRLCANGSDSLSGWISLGWFLAEAKLDAALQEAATSVRFTGAHVASLLAVQRNTADLASIDAWTFHQLSRWRPQALVGLRAIGHGPEVAVTPLITSLQAPASVLRHVLGEVGVDPELAPVRAALGITGFVEHGFEEHHNVQPLAHRVGRVLAGLRVADV
jgi:ABC-type phosphate/phosphonate transport system substrate-binding protein